MPSLMQRKYTFCDDGVTISLSPFAFCLFLKIFATVRMSSIRVFVQLPMKTSFTFTSFTSDIGFTLSGELGKATCGSSSLALTSYFRFVDRVCICPNFFPMVFSVKLFQVLSCSLVRGDNSCLCSCLDRHVCESQPAVDIQFIDCGAFEFERLVRCTVSPEHRQSLQNEILCKYSPWTMTGQINLQ